jgi:hypothetical protein
VNATMTGTTPDWMNLTFSDWMERTLPGWQDRSYGDLLRATPADWWAMMYPSTAATATPPSPSKPGWRHQHHHHHHHGDCGCYQRGGRHPLRREEHHHHDHPCGRCAPDSCECFCCIGDVDLAVYARLGEQRVIPIVVENERRREKEISLELSGWTTRGGKPAPVDTLGLEPKTFSLAPCAEREVTLVVRVRGADKLDANTVSGNVLDIAGAEVSRTPGDTTSTNQPRTPPDVDSCLVATADLRLVGCDHRPLRIAIAILPRDCEPFRVGCGCDCC